MAPQENGGKNGAGHAATNGDSVKIICVGVMRTGLKTLHRAMRELGHKEIYDQENVVSTFEHWDDVLWNRSTKESLRAIFQGSEVIMGMPTYCFWETILELYPDAQVILTVRDEDQWWDSVQHAKSLMDNEFPGAPLRYSSILRRIERFMVPSYHKFCEVLRFAWSTTLGFHALQGGTLNEAAARGNFRRHNSYVQSALSKRQTRAGRPQLLVYDVSDGWAPLCEFLGAEVPEKDFPNETTKSDGEGTVNAKVTADPGHEFEELLEPDSEFGLRMRQELRKSLIACVAGFTLIAAAMGLVVHMTQVIHIPVVFMAFLYIGLINVAWAAYAVIHGLVLRVPALLVLPMAMKSLLIAAALQACFITYGILKEMLVTQDKISSPVLVLSSRFMSIVCGALALLMFDGKVSFGAPLLSMSAFAFTNEASTWAGYEMLKYVSFPVQVMAKSVKMLPNMIMGRVLNGTKYSMYQYVQAVMALVCVGVMHFSDEHSDTKGGKGKGKGNDEIDDSNYKLLMGVALLLLFFVTDSFTSQWQTALYKKHPKTTQTQMMLGGNVMGFVFTSGSIVFSWAKISKSLGIAMQDPAIMGRIIALGVVSALGQFCIYSAIRILGPLSFTWIMTARQLMSVLISLVFFGHGINITKLCCILVVFAIMSSKQLSRIVPKTLPCRGKSKSISELFRGEKPTKQFFRQGTMGFLSAVGAQDGKSKKDA